MMLYLSASAQSDTFPPTTNITAPEWVTGNFTASFTDSDKGTGVQKKFYGVEEFSAGQWRGNKLNGFMNDAFDGSLIHPDWTVGSGVWKIESNALKQSDEGNVNSNLYASLNQNADAIVYHWSQKIGGSGTNQRGGLHFMCSAATGNARGNSYLVLERTDHGGSIQILRSYSDMLFLWADVPYPFISNLWYDFKVVYTRTSGKVDVFVNNKLSASWRDSIPLATGNYIGFRNGESIFYADNFEVMKSRGSTANISVGNSNANDIRVQNSAPEMPTARIKSLIVDSFNCSSIAIKNINVDCSVPYFKTVRDGTGADISTTSYNNQLSANWNAAVDTQSGIKRYWYGIGSSPGSVNILSWQDNELQTSVTRTGLRLNVGVTYYFTVKAENNAGLMSAPVNSNGQKVIAPMANGIVSAERKCVQQFSAYADPSENLNISYTLSTPSVVIITLNNFWGKEMACLVNDTQEEGAYVKAMNIQDLPKGFYLLILKTRDEIRTLKIVR